ncbi:hypothetical protein JZ751_006541 [Albula glossodonta]|uniref:C2H2-type domain-containing protein n=1 Tax=Albula glossodonta TaxID=121402 RepID=A0A8T2NAS6_9TELE|nr:hypothetical protein JZ751_006541 [Albula glossodonta]
MSAENNTAETPTDQAVPTGNIITIHTTLGDEDEDVHRCGRCHVEFTTLEAFIQHKLQNSCQRALEPGAAQPPADDKHDNSPEVVLMEGSSAAAAGMDDAAVCSEEGGRARHTAGRRRRGSTVKSAGLSQSSDAQEGTKIIVKVNDEGRYVCHVCEKTFKTVNILRTHMTTHSEKKNFHCKLCGNSFRTKGSLIRHNRRHTDERPYRCMLCGLSFRESGALTRHLRSITPCTEKIRFSQCKEILVNKEEVQKGQKQQPSPTVPSVEEQLPVVRVIDSADEVIHEVHMQVEVDSSEQAQQELQHAESVAEGDSLIGQAIINSGITLETEQGEQVGAKSPPHTLQDQDADGRVPEIQVREECVELHSEEALCGVCQKEFLTGYLLKKHMEAHLSERRFKCGECGKLYKTIAHNALQVHQRTHAQERPVTDPLRRGCNGAVKDSEQPVVMEDQASGGVAATIISEDPHAVLVEFSSVVADTQEYIIQAPSEVAEPGGEVPLNRNEVGSHIMKVVQQIVSQSQSGHQIIVQNVAMDENAAISSDCGDTITIATPESLTEQVAMTLASAISDGAILTADGTLETADGTVTMVESRDIEVMEQAEEFVITSPEEVEIQTVIVQD